MDEWPPNDVRVVKIFNLYDMIEELQLFQKPFKGHKSIVNKASDEGFRY